MTLSIRPRRLNPAAFAPFGLVFDRPLAPDSTRILGIDGMVNLRPGRAEARLGWFATPARPLPITAIEMERHRLSSQSFIPCSETDWLLLLAPKDSDDGPDMVRAMAFLADSSQAITLHPDIWHHPLTALSASTFAVLTFLAGDADDEEFRPLGQRLTIEPP